MNIRWRIAIVLLTILFSDPFARNQASAQSGFPISEQEYQTIREEFDAISLDVEREVAQEKLGAFGSKWLDRLALVVNSAPANRQEKSIRFNTFHILSQIASYHDMLELEPPNPLKPYEHLFCSPELMGEENYNTSALVILRHLAPLEDETIDSLIEQSRDNDHNEFVLGQIYGVLHRTRPYSSVAANYIIESLAESDPIRFRAVFANLYPPRSGDYDDQLLFIAETGLQSNEPRITAQAARIYTGLSRAHGLSNAQIDALISCFHGAPNAKPSREEVSENVTRVQIIGALTCRDDYWHNPRVRSFLLSTLASESTEPIIKQLVSSWFQKLP